MAKILLISVNDTIAEGARALSAVLKRSGHIPYILFLKRYFFAREKSDFMEIEEADWVGVNEKGEEYKMALGHDVSSAEKELMFSLIEEIQPDLIGFSVTTPLKNRVKNLTKDIKSRYQGMVLWGGYGPTIDPEDCSQYCDAVCVGEGEGAILDVAERIDGGRDISDVENLVFLKNGQTVRNRLRPLIDDLDTLPAKDIDPRNKFLIEDDRLVRDYKGEDSGQTDCEPESAYNIISSRGCPYSCSYCCGSFLKQLYAPSVFLRRRSPANVIGELKAAKETLQLKKIVFNDEVFSVDIKWLREFLELYKKEIDLPFFCFIFPRKELEETLRMFKDAGLVSVALGVQSGSDRINKEIFYRPFDREIHLKTARLLHELNISYYVDIITCNPFEKEEDLQATLSIISQLPKPFFLDVNKLYSVKGSLIYELIQQRQRTQEAVLPDRTFHYYVRLFFLARVCGKFMISTVSKIRLLRCFPFLVSEITDMVVFGTKLRGYLKDPSLFLRKMREKLGFK